VKTDENGTYSPSLSHIPFADFHGFGPYSMKSSFFTPSKQSTRYSSTFCGLLTLDKISKRA
jgi:hypothetical protein